MKIAKVIKSDFKNHDFRFSRKTYLYQLDSHGDVSALTGSTDANVFTAGINLNKQLLY